MKIYRIHYIKIIFFFASSLCFSQSYWVSHGWQSFKSAGDARIKSMGGAATTDAGTTISPLFNPASSAEVGFHNINYTHQSRFAGMINSDLLGFSVNKFLRPVNIIILYENIDRIPDSRNMLLDFGIDGVPGTGDQGESNGILDEGERLDRTKLKFISQNQTGLHMSTSWSKADVKFGVAIKTLYHSFGEANSNGLGIDLGIITFPWRNGKFGITVKDVTTSWQVWNNGTIERFAPALASGLSHKLFIDKFNLTINGAVNFIINASGWSLDDNFRVGKYGATYFFGMNIIYLNKVAVRIGRNKNQANTLGIGISWNELSLDYAFENEASRSDLGSTHIISLSTNIGLIEKYIRNL